MKTLFLIRHAKSSSGYPGIPDHSRPLKNRGYRDAVTMGQRLAQRLAQGEPIPQQLVSSSAIRAWSTAEIIATEIDYPVSEIAIEPQIYEADVRALLNVIHGFDDSRDCIGLIGHNPGFTELSNLLTGSNIDNVPTTGIVVLQFEVSTWAAVKSKTGSLLLFDYPKNR